MNVLLVSNGYGEAAIAGYLARAITSLDPAASIEHFPLVGRFPNSPGALRSVGPQVEMPSGGLVAYWNMRNWARDAGAGLFASTLRQFSFLSRQRDRDVVVAVGDVYCAAACLLFARRPTIFVATAKSERVAPHSALECAIARRADAVFARDEATAAALARRGVRASYAGNLMMDGIGNDTPPPLTAEARVVGVLPGSRGDAPENATIALRRLAIVARTLAPTRLQALVSVAPSVSAKAMLAASAQAGAPLLETGNTSGVIARADADGLEVMLIAGAFGDLLRASEIVLGQAGTGNEQAAGLGKPVVASSSGRGDGGPSGWYRMRQQRLLGDALLVLPDDDRAFADGVVELLRDPQRMEAMAAAGRDALGGPGGSATVAQAVIALASEKAR
jgi:uncharacterized protein (TIGR03492 family)